MATAPKSGTGKKADIRKRRDSGKTADGIKQGDCIKQLAKLKAGSVDLAFADPPFNIGYDYDEYDDKRTCDDYLDWSKKWMTAVTRVLKPDGTFWLAIGDEYAAELKVLATRELGLTCRSWVIWYYTFGVHCKTKFTRSHAHLFYFVKDAKRFTFNDAAVRVPSARQLVYGDKRANPKGRVPDDTWIIRPSPHDDWVLRPQDIPEAFTGDSDTWYYSRVCGTFKERQGFHGCQMPERLLGRIIGACSNGVVGPSGGKMELGVTGTHDRSGKRKAGAEPQLEACADERKRQAHGTDEAEPDLVLDPFAGSGTTLAVAKKLGRRYVGIELSKQYAAECRKRLKGIEIGDDLDGAENPLLSAPNTQNGTIRTPDGTRVKQNGTRGKKNDAPNRKRRKPTEADQTGLWG